MITMSTRATALRLVGAIELKSEKTADSANDVETKAVGVLEIKDEEKGEVEAIIATLDVVDRDGDIIRAGAIKSGATVKMSAYGHDAMWGETPVGKGTLHVEGDKAVFRGKVFLTTQRGREVFSVLKEMGTDQEWSFGFRVTGWELPDEKATGAGAHRVLTKLDAFEVSPVMRGAGVGTRTVAVKGEKPAEPPPADPPPTPTPEELAAATKAEAEAKAAQERADAEAKAAADRLAAERKARAQAAIDDAQSTLRRLRRLGYVA
jgi:hypothetical protein